MKGLLRLRDAGAELSERVQDVYAEAQAEYTAEMFERDDGQPAPHAGPERGG